MLFSLGQVVATPGALTAISEAHTTPLALLGRHLRGDWGHLCTEDERANRYALKHGLRLLSAYTLSEENRIWIITEADRSATTLLLPSEY